MAKKVSEEQMEELFTFTRKHFVEYYDLQTELADHLANAIEESWITYPTLDFAKAKEQEFKKFGIFGFMGIVEQRQAVLTKKYQKLMWGYFKEFFKLPRIILTILFILIVYKILSFNIIAYSLILGAIVLISIYRLVTMWVKHKQKIKQTGKKWLLEEIITRCGGMIMLLNVPAQIFFRLTDVVPNTIVMWLMSIVLVAFALYQYTILYIIPSKAEEHLMATYPEYNLKF
ncbi:hypothetical protein [Flavobacterium cerinum]|uniref:Uncharacterized protein n=1 Tax=Flavobacterium cerinum TaxID=2502784 RepID=A0A3S3SEC0_9FLAO|nr:hypothetical protein [Flavobacterium cerinum]RWX00042.1 hypothetical protein EPI11_10895 [Flavobacterium cerinum]